MQDEEEERLIAKLRKIEALFARATSAGERGPRRRTRAIASGGGSSSSRSRNARSSTVSRCRTAGRSRSSLHCSGGTASRAVSLPRPAAHHGHGARHAHLRRRGAVARVPGAERHASRSSRVRDQPGHRAGHPRGPGRRRGASRPRAEGAFPAGAPRRRVDRRNFLEMWDRSAHDGERSGDHGSKYRV